MEATYVARRAGRVGAIVKKAGGGFVPPPLGGEGRIALRDGLAAFFSSRLLILDRRNRDGPAGREIPPQRGPAGSRASDDAATRQARRSSYLPRKPLGLGLVPGNCQDRLRVLGPVRFFPLYPGLIAVGGAAVGRRFDVLIGIGLSVPVRSERSISFIVLSRWTSTSGWRATPFGSSPGSRLRWCSRPSTRRHSSWFSRWAQSTPAGSGRRRRAACWVGPRPRPATRPALGRAAARPRFRWPSDRPPTRPDPAQVGISLHHSQRCSLGRPGAGRPDRLSGLSELHDRPSPSPFTHQHHWGRSFLPLGGIPLGTRRR